MSLLSATFKHTFTALLLASVHRKVDAAEECSTTWKCHPISSSNAPVLDGDIGDWSDVEPFTTSLSGALTNAPYLDGEASTYKCVYDDERIYFSLEIPGDYRFNATDKEKCAAIGTMTKVGMDATFVNMGGCPDAMGGCPDGVPDTCEPYRVDVGAHWELKTTQQGVAYNVPEVTGGVGGQQTPTTGTGDDPIANNDDEYSVSAFCRFDDDDVNAGNEWAGAWKHTNPVEGELGVYHFEISRSLKTPSTVTDAQYAPGSVSSFGVAYWDPFETPNGWTHAGHFVTGCSTKWIDLELVSTSQEEDTNGASAQGSTSGAPSGRFTLLQVAGVIAAAAAVTVGP